MNGHLVLVGTRPKTFAYDASIGGYRIHNLGPCEAVITIVQNKGSAITIEPGNAIDIYSRKRSDWQAATAQKQHNTVVEFVRLQLP